MACGIFEVVVGTLFVDGCCAGKLSCVLETTLLSVLAEGTSLEGSDTGTTCCCCKNINLLYYIPTLVLHIINVSIKVWGKYFLTILTFVC